MAGSFGATTRGYDLSMEIAEMDLFARLDEHPEATVVAPGTSCRQQVRDGRGRDAVHPVEVIARALGVGDAIE
jgi:Fe-S oxidoreductase